MLLMVEKGIRVVICHYINRYEKANNKYMKDYNKNEESSYCKYWDVNNLNSWAMPLKLPVNGFEQLENRKLIKSYHEESDERYFNEVDAQYPEKLQDLLNDLPFLHERIKI